MTIDETYVIYKEWVYFFLHRMELGRNCSELNGRTEWVMQDESEKVWQC